MLPGYSTPLRARHLLFAAIVGGVAVVIRAVAHPYLGDELPFIVALPAVVAIAAFGGPLPAMVVAIVCALGVASTAIPPIVEESRRLGEYGWFATATLFAAWLSAKIRSVRHFEHLGERQASSETHLGTWLRTVLWGAVSLPLFAFVGVSWWSLERAQKESQASLTQSSSLALQHAQRTLDVAQEIAVRVDKASRFPKDQERAKEREIHVRLSDMAAGLGSVVNANVWDAAGACIARSDQYPAAPCVGVSDREYFQERQRASPSSFGLSDLLVGRQTGRAIFNVTKRRETADGVFSGIVSVSLSPTEFIEYYKSLAGNMADLATFALVKTDGAVLARWPEETEIGYLAVGSPLMTLLVGGQSSGTTLIDAEGGRGTQQVAYQRIGNLPLYMVSGVNRTAVLARWASFVGVLAAIILPITAGLVYVTWIAMRKTRQEEAVAGLLQEQIRARADAERRVLEAQKLETLSLLTGSIAHDFNNLLSVISSSLHVHRKRRPDVAEDKALDAMAKAVQTGVRLTRQLLSFSKKQALRPEIVQFQAWLPHVDPLLRTTLGAMATWTCTVDLGTKPVKVDVGELELALINLILNAKLAMPRGGALRLHVYNDGDATEDAPMVIVSVVDNGEGIPSNTLPKVFEPFFTTRQKGAGSGLGLSQVQSFCVNSGGRVSIKSVLGEGTTVCLHLPALAGQAVAMAPPQPADGADLKARLLLVEDNDEVAQTTMQMLESSGLTVVRAESADAALEYLAKDGATVDLVLSDIAMPGTLNGIGLALTLRRLYPKLPVLLHTGYADQLGEATAKGLRVLQKPVPPAVLLPELKAIMERA